MTAMNTFLTNQARKKIKVMKYMMAKYVGIESRQSKILLMVFKEMGAYRRARKPTLLRMLPSKR